MTCKLSLILALIFLSLNGFCQNISSVELSSNTTNVLTVSAIFDSDGPGDVFMFNSTISIIVPGGYTSPVVADLQGGSWSISSTIPNSALIGACGAATAGNYYLIQVTSGGEANLGSVTTGVAEGLFTVTFAGSDALNVYAYDPDGGDALSVCLDGAGVDNTADVDPDGNGGPSPSVSNGNIPPTPLQGVALPVELTSFDLHPNENTFDLYWSSASEIAFDGYEIQRSTDGRNFKTIAWQAGKGSETTAMSYTYTDDTVKKAQDYYYRLKMVDLDGGFEYSEVLQGRLRGKDLSDIVIFPNPTQEKITIRMEDSLNLSNIQLNVFDANGKIVLQQARTFDTLMEVDVSQLTQGVYYLEVGEQGVVSFTKQ